MIPTTIDLLIEYFFICAILGVIFIAGMIVISGVEKLCKRVLWDRKK